MGREIYRIFEDIVGPENISDDPVILETYSFNWLTEFLPRSAPSKFMEHRPLAVVLPGSTEEVQKIVKVCNAYKIKFKALSTGYGSHSLPGQENVLVIDLKRMNRIVEIDEKNKFAVVEPYVVWAQLQAEVMKVGLFTTPVQAGSQASVLANLTSGWGMNTFGNHGGHNGRNVLGVEWVLPTGEILKLGPPSEWFTGDGPGPSLRGIMRGHCGAQGGLGIFTKVGIKLHNWPGPPVLETEPTGLISAYSIKNLPEFIEVITPSFDTYEDLANFLYRAGEEEIAYCLVRVGSVEHMITLAGSISNKEIFEQFFESGFVQSAKELIKHPCVAVIFGNTEREFNFKRKVAYEIIEECGGKIFPVFEEGILKKFAREELLVALIGNDTHFIHHAGGFVISAGYMGTADAVIRHMGLPQERLKKKYIERGKILADGEDSTYHNSFENNAYIYMEMEFHYDAANPSSVEDSREALREERETLTEEKLGFEPNDIALCVGDSKMHPAQRMIEIGKRYGNFHIWQEKIKNAFDPDDLSDRSNYGGGIYMKKEK